MSYCRDCQQFFDQDQEECPLCGLGLVADSEAPGALEYVSLKLLREFSPADQEEAEIVVSLLRSFGIEPLVGNEHRRHAYLPLRIFVREAEYEAALEITKPEEEMVEGEAEDENPKEGISRDESFFENREKFDYTGKKSAGASVLRILLLLVLILIVLVVLRTI